MSLSRRQLLKLIATGVAGYGLIDYDRLLWIPGEKTIFIPRNTHAITLSEIVATELECVLPRLATLFERDDTFYSLIKKT